MRLTGVAVVPPAAAVAGWGYLHQPMHAAGFVLLLLPGLVAGVAAPGMMLSFRSLPLLLVPDRWRMWWRRGHKGRPHIPLFLRRAVYAADGHRCCWCGSVEDLQLDHIKPWSFGGLSVMWNMMTLCGYDNRVKSNYWVTKGRVYYKPFEGSENQQRAHDILMFELRHRWSPGRWIRAGWSLTR